MLARKQMDDSLTAAKIHLKNYGWTYRSAAPVLGVCYPHLSQVLNGHRTSRRLVSKVMDLPVRAKQEA